MPNSPDEELAERIINIFKEKRLVSERERSSFETKLKAGNMSQEDWKIFAESTIYDKDSLM